MTGISLPDPVLRRGSQPTLDVRALERDLRQRVDGEVRFDAGSRGAYSTDASNYRQVPIGVVVPRTIEAGVAAVAVCREHGAPVVSRGGGTSLAGQTCNVAVVIDWSKYCHRVSLGRPGREDVHRRAGHRPRRAQRPAGAARADVRPAAGHARSLHPRRHARQQLVRVDGAGLRQDGRQRRPARGPHLRRRAILGRPDQRRRIRGHHRRGRPPRRHLPAAPRADRGPRPTWSGSATRRSRGGCRATTWTRCCPNAASTWAGHWSAARARWSRSCTRSCAWCPRPAARSLVVLGYPDIASAADAVPHIAPHQPEQLEGVDEPADHLRAGAADEPQGPAAAAGGQRVAHGHLRRGLQGRGRRQGPGPDRATCAGTEHEPTVRFYDDPEHEQELADVREVALGATARVPDMPRHLGGLGGLGGAAGAAR